MKDEKDSVRQFQTTQRGVLIAAASVPKLMVNMNVPAFFLEYGYNLIRMKDIRKAVNDYLRKSVPKEVVGYGNVFIFDSQKRMIYHNGKFPERYIGAKVGKIFRERERRYGAEGLGKISASIDRWGEGTALFKWSASDAVMIGSWKTIPIHNGDKMVMMLYAERKEVLKSMGFYDRLWKTLIGALFFNLLFFFAGVEMIRMTARQSALEEREKNREEFFKAEKKYRHIFEMSTDLIAIFDKDGVVVDVNPAVVETVGVPKEVIVGRHFTDFDTEEEKEKIREIFVANFEKRRRTEFEAKLKTVSGRDVPLSVVGTIYEHDGKLFAQGIGRDITKQRERENQRIVNAKLEAEIEHLRKLNILKTNFLSMVSHELRTPLAVILGNIGLLLGPRASELPEAALERLRTVERRGRELKKLIDDLLSLASIDADKLSMNLETFTVADFVGDILSKYENISAQGMIRFETDIRPGDLVLTADRYRLSQAVDNLVNNAIKFSPPGEKVTVETFSEKDEIVIAVSDNGPGIPDEALDQVFDRFYQVDSTLARRSGGVGIGLAITRELVKLHGGRISIQNVDPEGLRVEIRLPKLPARMERLKNAAGEKKLVLIVDDDEEFCSLIGRFLEDNGYRVMSEGDIDRAAASIKNEKPALVMLDAGIFPYGGLEACRMIKEIPEAEGTFVFLTGTPGDESLADKARAAGASDYIQRPFDFGDFLSKVKLYTGQYA